MSFWKHDEPGDETLADGKGTEQDGTGGFLVSAVDPAPVPDEPGTSGDNGPHVKLKKGSGREKHRVEKHKTDKGDVKQLGDGTKWFHGQVAGVPSEEPEGFLG